MSNLHVADLTGTHLRQSTPITDTLSPFLSTLFLASGYGGFPSGCRHLGLITAGMRCGLVQSVARSDRDRAVARIQPIV